MVGDKGRRGEGGSEGCEDVKTVSKEEGWEG